MSQTEPTKMLSEKRDSETAMVCDYEEIMPHFSFEEERSRNELHKKIFFLRIFLAEFLASAMVAFPYFMIDESLPYAVISQGLAVSAAVYSAVWIVYPISGAHLNPVVSFACFLTRRISGLVLPLYWTSQFLGTLVAMATAYHLSPYGEVTTYAGMTYPWGGVSNLKAVLLEILSTFLVLTLILAGTDERREGIWTMSEGGNMAITYTLIYLVNILVGRHASGASMNPFRSIAAAIVKGRYERQWIYLVGPLLGCLISVLFYEVVLSGGACLTRTKAWLCDPKFDRDFDYLTLGRPPRRPKTTDDTIIQRSFTEHGRE